MNDWVCNNHLTINANKTKFMLISHRRNLPKNFPTLYINNIQIDSVSHFKYLGIWISEDLTWSKHVESICCKAHRILGYMFRTFSPHCNQDSIIALQVLPILEYAYVVWDPHLIKDQQLLESVQLFATRMAARSWTSDSESLNYHFQLPSLSSRRIYFKVLSTYKCLNSYIFCPPGNFSLHANLNLCVCHCKELVVPFAKTSVFYNSFFISSARQWNSLPSHVILCANVSLLRMLLNPFS